MLRTPLLPMVAAVLGVALLATGCASLPPHASRTTVSREDVASSSVNVGGQERLHRRRSARLPSGTVVGKGDLGALAVDSGLLGVDALDKLLVHAGLDAAEELPPRTRLLTPDDAARVLGLLLNKPVTRGNLPPRMAAAYLLREVLEGWEVARGELVRRVGRFGRVAVLRPDGYLAWVLNGATQQRVAPVQWREGAFRAGPFELGRFYVSNGVVFRRADEALRPVEPLLAEVYDDADVVNRTLDGAQEAFVELAHALGRLFAHPMESLAALRHLPQGVGALIAASPEYWERFRHMTAGEQMQAVSKLTTALLSTWGAAAGTTRTVTGKLAGAQAQVPVLSLSAEGALVIERLAVPVGQAASVLGRGPGAALILQRASPGAKGSSSAGGPGQWGPARESMSSAARRYQEQVTGRSAEEAYWVGGTKFDGFKDGVLLEAKGPNYANKFQDNLEPEHWFRDTGAEELVEQARRQSRKAQGLGLPIEWHVAEKKVAEAIRKLLKANGIEEITVIHTPAR